MEVPQKRWFIRENPVNMDDLGGTPMFGNLHIDGDGDFDCWCNYTPAR